MSRTTPSLCSRSWRYSTRCVLHPCQYVLPSALPSSVQAVQDAFLLSHCSAQLPACVRRSSKLKARASLRSLTQTLPGRRKR